jgi:hypothetical protein
MDKENMVFAHSGKYFIAEHSAIKKNGIMSFAGKWMELEIITLSETTQMEKANIASFFSYVECRS